MVEPHRHAAHVKLHAAWHDENYRPKLTLYGALALVISGWLVVTLLLRLRARKRQYIKLPKTPDIEKRSPFKTADRTLGGT